MQEHLKKIQSSLLSLQTKAKGLYSKIEEQIGRDRSVIGIDLGVDSVKVVQLEKVNGTLTIVKSAIVNIGGLAGNQEEALASLKTAVIGMDTKGARVIATVNCPQTCTRKIIAPHMPKKELAQAVRWEAKNAIPFSLDQALMDYKVLDEISEKDVRKLLVVVAASPQSTVDQIVSLFAKAGLEISALIPVSVGAQNLIAHSKEKVEETQAIIEMGASVTELNIYRDGQLAFSRKLPVAGDDITRSLTSTLMSTQGKVELSFEEAEKVKKEVGIPAGAEETLIDGKILPSQILSLIRPCVEQLADEIDRSFDFYREESRGGQVNKIVLFGGGASLKGLAESLSKELEMDIEIGNAFEGIGIASGALSGQEGVASRFGLAVGAALSKANVINLLPLEVKEKTRRFVEHVSLQAVAIGVIVTIVLSIIGLNIQIGAQQKKIKAFKLEKKTLSPQIEALRLMHVANQIQMRHPSWEDVLLEISSTMQPRMYLTGLSMSEDVVNFVGVIDQGDQKAQAALSNFMITLENGIFKNVSLVSSERETEGRLIFEFEIEAEVE